MMGSGFLLQQIWQNYVMGRFQGTEKMQLLMGYQYYCYILLEEIKKLNHPKTNYIQVLGLLLSLISNHNEHCFNV